MEYNSIYGEFVYSIKAAVEHALEAGLIDTKDDLTYLGIEVLYAVDNGESEKISDCWSDDAREVYRVDGFDEIMELDEVKAIGSGVIFICDATDGEPELSGVAVRYYNGESVA